MTHVVTQWETGQWAREGIESGRARANSESLRPITFSPTNRHSGGLRTKKDLNFPGTPESGRWDFGSIRHIKQGSTEMRTPVSAVDSVFELPCNESHASPNSSAHSSFMAELEAIFTSNGSSLRATCITSILNTVGHTSISDSSKRSALAKLQHGFQECRKCREFDHGTHRCNADP